MAAAFTLAGFEAWDVNMDDLITQRTSLSAFRGVAFVGGFSYADVCGSAKGEKCPVCIHADVEIIILSLRMRAENEITSIGNIMKELKR